MLGLRRRLSEFSFDIIYSVVIIREAADASLPPKMTEEDENLIDD